MRLTDGSARARLTLAVDLAAIGVFVVLGMRSHRSGGTLVAFARTAVPLGAAWFGASFALRTYRPPTYRALVRTFLVAVPAGVLGRTLWVGSPEGVRILVFLGVALAFLALCIGAGRVILEVAGRLTARLDREGRSRVRRAGAQ